MALGVLPGCSLAERERRGKCVYVQNCAADWNSRNAGATGWAVKAGDQGWAGPGDPRLADTVQEYQGFKNVCTDGFLGPITKALIVGEVAASLGMPESSWGSMWAANLTLGRAAPGPAPGPGPTPGPSPLPPDVAPLPPVKQAGGMGWLLVAGLALGGIWLMSQETPRKPGKK